MSRLIRAMRGVPTGSGRDLSPAEMRELLFSLTGQSSSLPPEMNIEGAGDPAADYLKGPSMASILLKNAKGMTLRNLMEEAQLANADPDVAARVRARNETEMAMAPMIASIRQLDR